MSKFKAAIAELAKIQKALGVKFANADEMARALAKERAAAAGLPDVVFHGSPHAFSEFNVGDDYFRHVAPDPLVAAQRIKDLNIPVSERKFNLTPEAADKLGFSPEDLKGGFVHELRTNLGKPLRVKDPGFFDLDRLLEDPSILNALSPEDLKIIQDKYRLIEQKQKELLKLDADKYFGLNPQLEQINQLENEIKDLEKEGINFLGESLQKQGYGSLHYKNTAEVPKQYRSLHSAYLEIERKITAIDEALRNVKNPVQAKKLQEAKAELTGVLSELEDQFPDSYALFRNTPVRNILAEMDPAKLSDSGSLLNNVALATGVGTAAAALAPEESEAGVLTKLDDIAKAVSKVKNPTRESIQKVLGVSNPKTRQDIGETVLSYFGLLDYATREKLGMKMGDSIEKVNDKIISNLYPYYELDKDTIAGLYDGRTGKKQLIDELVSRDKSNRTPTQKREHAIRRTETTGGMFFGDPVEGYPETIYKPGGIFLHYNDPSILQHELEHELDAVTNPQGFSFINPSYTYEHPLSSSFIKDNITSDNLNRFISSRGYKTSPDEVIKNLRKKGITFDDSDAEKQIIDRYITNSLRQKPGNIVDFNVGGHFTTYNNFELEKALELLNEQVRMPSISPSVRKRQIAQLEKLSPSTDEAQQLAFELSQDAGRETVPLRDLESQKRKYQDQMTQHINRESALSSNPKLMTAKERARLEELDREFEGL